MTENQTRVGRGQHLMRLALIFRHRQAGWNTFGRFLNTLFAGPDSHSRITRPRQPISCRHSEGARHAVTAAEGEDGLLSGSEQHRRPCIAVGSFDPHKNPGLVVDDLCSLARVFLADVGMGAEGETRGRDYEYFPSSDRESSPMTIDPDSQGAIDADAIIDGPESGRRLRPRHGSDSPEIVLISDDDVQGAFDAEAEDAQLRLARDPTLSPVIDAVTDDPESDADSIRSRGRRVTTKIRAATLAYLWKFSDDPGRLQAEFRRLRDDASLQVLHLCGCGISLVSDDGKRSFGCCERSHLTLGSPVMNDHHKTYHEVLRLSRDEDYTQLCRVLNRAVDGEGVF